MKKICIAFTICILFFFSAACSAQKPGELPVDSSSSDISAGSARAAVIDDFSGDVVAVSNGNDMPAFKGLALLREDSLGTGIESWSSLELSDQRFILIEENSDVLISQLVDEAENAEITLSAGRIWVIINDKLSGDESLEVKTPACSLSVRGTVFAVSCDEAGGSRVAVYEGTVDFTARDENGAEVTFGITRGTAEIIAENGVVLEIKQGGLTADDWLPMREGGPDGPGGVYAVLRMYAGSSRAMIYSSFDTPDGYNVVETMWGNIRYEGYWQNGMPNGEGTCYFYNMKEPGNVDYSIPPHILSGTFVDGLPHGEVKHTAVYIVDDGYVSEIYDVVYDMGHSVGGAGFVSGFVVGSYATPWTLEAKMLTEYISEYIL